MSFSYAQAAKGRTPAPATPPAPAADSHLKDDASSVTTAPDASAKTFSTSSEVSESVKSSQIEADVGSKKPGETAGPESVSAPAKDNATIASDTTAKPDTPSTNESSARPSHRSNDPTDSKKGRKGKKSRNSEKEAESEQAAAELEKEKAKKDIANLVEGAPPSVNVWQQRAEAKAKQPSLTAIMAAAESKSKSSVEASTKAPSNIDGGATKAGEAARATTDQSVRKARGSRAVEKGEQGSVPSSAVEDATSWPTPDTVAADDGKRKTSIEPDSREKQDDGGKAARAKPTWTKVEITPSVVFVTPLPQRGPAKPRGGGQASRGGRGHSASLSLPGEKTLEAASDVPASKEGGAETQTRPRVEDVRTTLPASEKTKKFNADQPSQRKQSVAAGARGPATGDYAPKNEAFKASTVHEPTTKKENFSGHGSKPKRGGAHTNGRGAHNGQQSFASNGNGPPRGNNHSPLSYGPGASFPPFGGSRGRGRPGPGGNGFKGPANGMGKMHTQHNHQANPDYSQFPVFNQAPYQPAPGTTHHTTILIEALRTQVDFYFGDENLYADQFLKMQMDGQGFVPFEIIANFNRMRNMAAGDVNAIRAAVLECQSVEYVIGDGKELLRRRNDWQKFVIDSSKPGPQQVKTVSNKYTSPQNAFYQPMPYSQYDPTSPHYGPAYHAREMQPGYMNRHQFPGNGAQINEHIATDNSPLNVAAAEFSPVHAGPNGFMGHFPPIDWEEQTLRGAETFSDSQVADLQIILEGQASTLSDSGKTTNGTTEATPVLTNGVQQGSESSAAPEASITNGEPSVSVYTALNGSKTPASDAEDREAYAIVYDRAVAQRQAATGELPKDMQRLYIFWAHFLPSDFNLAAYRQFRQFALEDAAAPMYSKSGYSSLVKFYRDVLSKRHGGGLWAANHPIYDIFRSHFESAQMIVDGSVEQA